MSEGSPYQEDDASQLAGEVFGGKLGVEESLAKLRTRLLDLSMRNRLLNYRLPKGRSLQFTANPDLDQVFERLEEGKSIQLAYVPDPSPYSYEAGKKPEVRDHAKVLGISTSVDLEVPTQPTTSGRSQSLQVLLYPAEMERISRKISSEARTVVEETGTNMLYLIFGFLEYYDGDDSEKAVVAPLLSMPVALNKGALDKVSRTFIYELTHSGDDIAENFTLREKLRQLRLELPAFDDEESPVAYFNQIEQAVSKRRNWKVLRRLTLGFLSFGKLAIWADLDPSKASSLLSSELLRSIFSGESASASGAFHAEDYDVDAHVDGELPLIYDADSSQHSALIDVKQGKSLVINGPPGTGKSQTITNIIATAMAAGKKVLFVSEKLAALEVVKQRLEKAALGDFCLELHSHKTQKKQLLASIEQRTKQTYSAPIGYNKRTEILRQRRKELNAYAHLLSSRIGNCLELTLHEVFWATERRRLALGETTDALVGLVVNDAAHWGAERVARCHKNLGDAANSLSLLGCSPSESPWFGFYPPLLIKGDEVAIMRAVGEALSQARAMLMACSALTVELPGTVWSMAALLAAEPTAPILASIPASFHGELLARMLPHGIEGLDSARLAFGRLQSSLSRAHDLQRTASAALADPLGFDHAQMERCIRLAEGTLSERGLNLTPEALGEQGKRLQAFLEHAQRLRSNRPARVPQDLLRTYETLSETLQAADWSIVSGVPAEELARRARLASAVEAQTSTALAGLSKLMREGGVSFGGHADEVERLLVGGTFQELLPSVQQEASKLDELRLLAATGWGEWSAAQFEITAVSIVEALDGARQAQEDLAAFFSRVGLPFTTSRSCLDSIQILLQVAETAPRELLPLRCPGLESASFSDIAIKAEETRKGLAHKAAKVEGAFHLDSLPDEEELLTHIKALRRSESLFNFLRSDWRAAKAAFRLCTKSNRSLTPQVMSEHLRAVQSWRSAVASFEADTEAKGAMGGLFAGMKTDFGKVRRLHGWVRSSQASLLATDFAQHVSPTQMSEQQIALLVAGANKVRQCIGKLQELNKVVKDQPGLDPALARVRRIEELYKPLEEYSQVLKRSGRLLASLARPTASVQRALQLLELQSQIRAHETELRSAVAAPARLAELAGELGLSSSMQQYRDLPVALNTIAQRASAIERLTTLIGSELSAAFAPREALELLHALVQVDQQAAGALAQTSAQSRENLAQAVAARVEQAAACVEISEYLVRYVHKAKSIAEAISASRASIEAHALLVATTSDKALCELFGEELRGSQTNVAAIEDCLSWAQQVGSIAKYLPAGAVTELLGANSVRMANLVSKGVGDGCAALKRYEAAMSALSRFGRIDRSQWGGTPNPDDAVQRLARAFDGEGVLVAWSKYLAAKEDSADFGVQGLIERCEQGKLDSTRLVTAFDYVFFRTLSRGVLSIHKELARFNGTSHEQLREDFASLDKEVIALTGQKYAAEIDARKKLIPGVASGRAGDLTEMALLTKEINKQKRHIPIRQLLRRAGKSLQQLKPCFMMGPLSVAQYLEQGHLSFDLIVMDEASQLRPEDALGAIARGKQLVVVGDPKQLPPTSFFDRLMDDDSDDSDEESSVVDGVESILGICEHLFRPVRTLRWHYRSQHESLIAFSNSQFYDHRLVVFPAPYKRNRRLGVNYRYVKEGIYQDRRNHPEAQKVVDAVVEHMLTCPEESLAVVTLNQTQRELIEDLLDKRLREVHGAALFLERHEKSGWPFFVKNLENVQGDERDVIFVSTTFGKPPGSSVVRQGFGPINRSDGWRRLNVLFTRARRRIDLFTSMLPEDVRLEARASLGRRALRDYLDYAKSGRLPSAAHGKPTEREAENDFELSVADALHAQGFETEPQVGVAGYFVDLGVRHPNRGGEFLAGIECDGVTYHSSLSARDRDRIRQEILESLGWRGRIVRVWSTDWFADPKGQTARLVRFLKERLRQDESSPPPYSDEDLEEHAEELHVQPPVAEAAGTESDPAPFEQAPVPAKYGGKEEVLFVELGDRVTYEISTDPPQRHSVQIVDSPSNLKLGLLNDGAPVARALLGLCEGDVAELRVKDQPPRGLKVLRIERHSADVA